MSEANIESLVGEVLSYVDVNADNDEIMLTTKSGRVFRIFHEQDCCEQVLIESTEGDWNKIIGKVINEASQSEVQDEDPQPDDYSVSWTRTALIFKTDSETVISQWIGTSNGYYSESITIEELPNILKR